MASWIWAASVYETIRATNTTNVAFQKKQKNNESSNYYNQTSTFESDLQAIKEKFSDYYFKGAVRDNWGDSLYVQGQLPSGRSEVFNPQIASWASLTEDDMTNLNFSFAESESRLPEGNSLDASEIEMCISKFTLFCLKKVYKDDNLDWRNLTFEKNIGGYVKSIKIVGIIDDKVDWSTYTSKTDEQLNNEFGSIWKLSDLFNSGFARVGYVSSELFDAIRARMLESASCYFHYEVKNGNSTSGTSISTSLNSLRNVNDYREYLEQHLVAFVGGVNHFSNGSEITYDFNSNELIVSIQNFNFSGWDSDTIQNKINEGFYIKLSNGYGGDLATYKIVGVYDDTSSEYYSYTSEQTINATKGYLSGYYIVLTHLTGTRDKELITYLETDTGNGIKFTIENDATSTLDLFEDIIVTFVNYIIYVAIGLAVFASLILMNYISNSISYKKREIGVLRALGARSSDVFGIFFNEATIIAFINFLISFIATFIICIVMNASIVKGLNMQITLFMPGIRQVILILAISWGSAFISSLLPTTRISRKKPIDAINNR